MILKFQGANGMGDSLNGIAFAVREIVFGALIMLFLIFEPRGIVALFSRLKGNK